MGQRHSYTERWGSLGQPTTAGASGRGVEEEVVRGEGRLACQLVLRAPSDGILAEYATTVSRSIALTLKWLEWDPPSIQRRVLPGNPSRVTNNSLIPNLSSPCAVVAGGGASEFSLRLLFERLAARSSYSAGAAKSNAYRQERDVGKDQVATPLNTGVENRSRLPRGPGDTVSGSGSPGGLKSGIDGCIHPVKLSMGAVHRVQPEAIGIGTDESGARGSNTNLSSAFSVLAAAVSVIPDALFANASLIAGNTNTGGSKHQSAGESLAGGRSLFRLRHDLKRLHDCDGAASTALIVRMPGGIKLESGMLIDDYTIGDSTADCDDRPRFDQPTPYISLKCGLEAGVVQPLALKYCSLVALIEAMASMLRIGGVVRVRGAARSAGGWGTGGKEREEGNGDCTGNEE